MKSNVVRYSPAIARIARRSRSKAERPGARSASHSALASSITSTAGPVDVPPRGRMASPGVNGQANVYCRVSSAAEAPAASRPAAITAHHALRVLSVIAVLRRIGLHVLRPADASCKRQLHGEIERIEPERQAEQVDLDALLEADEDPKEAEQAELRAGPARAPRKQRRAEVILADRGRRKVGLELWNGPQHVRDEGIRVRARPHTVARGVRVRSDRLLDSRDGLGRR